MELYHGSNVVISHPDLKYSHKTRDFGKVQIYVAQSTGAIIS